MSFIQRMAGSAFSYGASCLQSTTRTTANTVVGVTSGIARTAMFFTIPQSTTVALGVGGATWYARQTALAHAPQVLSNLCVRTATHFAGDTLGRFVANTVLIPTIVPAATPIVAGGVAIGTYLAVTGIGNAINHFASQNERTAPSTVQNLSEDDFVMVEGGEKTDAQQSYPDSVSLFPEE